MGDPTRSWPTKRATRTKYASTASVLLERNRAAHLACPPLVRAAQT